MLLYAFSGWLGLKLAVPPGYATLIWPASGIAAAALLIFGSGFWPGVFLGAVAVNTYNSIASAPDGDVWVALLNASLIACGSTLQALFVSSMVRRRFGLPMTINNSRDIVLLVLIAGPIACLIASTFGISALIATGILSLDGAPGNWLVWWLGDMAGILIVVPIAVLGPWKNWNVYWRGSPVPALTATMTAALFLLIGATLVAWKVASVANYERNNAAFSALADESEKALSHRLDSYRQSLDGGAGLFAASDHVSLADWQTYVDTLDVTRTLPGINGVGYIEPVRRDAVPSFLDRTARDGLPGFEIHPKTSGSEHFVIKYIEPIAVNKEAVGLDISFETNRLNAAVRARDSGMTAVTQRIFLVQDHTKQPGFLLLKPVYRTTLIPQTVESRRKAFLGWVYAPFIANRFMEGLTASQGQSINIRIVDGPSKDGNVIFDSGVSPMPSAQYSVTKRLDVFQQQWTITWASTHAFERDNATWEAWTVLASGLAITAIFAFLLMSLARREAYVRKEVDTRTSEVFERERGLEKALAALKISERRFSSLAGLSPAGIFRTDNYGFCNFVNEAWLEASRLSANEAMGAGWIDAIHPEDRDRVHRTWLSSIGSEESVRIEFRFRERDDGGVTWIDLISGPEFDDNGKLIGFIGVAIDITERKELEANMAAALESAEQATRAKSSFLANMSHEIRTPMNGVIGFAELLREGELSSEQRRQVDLILESSRSMMRLLNDILDISKIEAGQMKIAPEPVELPREISRYVSAFLPLAEKKGLQIETDISSGVPTWISVDPLRLRQIVTNLLGNAIKFTHTGKVCLRACMKPGNILAIEVEDTGIGIADERQSSLFQQFVQADDSAARKYGGTGLGLAISFNLAKLMGGSLSLRSTQGEGTTVTLELPALPAEPNETLDNNIELTTAPASASPAALKILLVEDHDINQVLITDMIRQLGYGVDLACDGEQALEMVSASFKEGSPYQLVLMDLQMPSMDGREATRRIRAMGIHAPDLPIIALSANAYPEDVQECLAIGMQAHLAKPVRLRELEAAIARWGTKGNAPPKQPETKSNSAKFGEALTARYEKRKNDTFSYMEKLAQEQDLGQKSLEELHDMLHKLAGTAGMFGEEALGLCAREIEYEMPMWRDPQKKEILRALERLNAAAGRHGTEPNHSKQVH
ncbi:CHASE domain-containing protein [Novosphingobium beihaiensis]|uniref:histidine kinase n=1 Tax=Novosphingobium beihaiensis TaxID=2930389 RepID=A0ABT0BV40_9SPHN|nr:CHASE domain-containing protein [Novosphingobium beihaiensis]MCJ2188872.1 CHASE domain-containing protein [Novosphingobium beihaiensis]